MACIIHTTNDSSIKVQQSAESVASQFREMQIGSFTKDSTDNSTVYINRDVVVSFEDAPSTANIPTGAIKSGRRNLY